MSSTHTMPVLTLLCISLMLSGPCLFAAGDGIGADPMVGPVDRLLGQKTIASPNEADEARATMEQLDTLRANPKERRRLIMVAQMLLGRFGYGIGPFDGRFDDKTRRAIKYYQESNKLAATGELDVRTLQKLMDDSDWLEQSSVQLPPYVFISDEWDVSVMASGTWTIVNGRQPLLLQTTHIACNRKWISCVESTAVVEQGNQLVLNVEHNEVERWDSQDIVTKPKSTGCVTETLRLSRSQKSVTRIRAPAISELCRRSEGQTVTLRLESGVKVWAELMNARKEGFRRIMKTGDFSFEDQKE